MRRLQRPTLAKNESDWLAEQTTKILDKPARAREAEADRLWKSAKQHQRSNQLGHIHKRLQDMCSGLARCMYCEDGPGSAIEHFWPRVHSPLRTFCWDNLLYACTHCNSNEKRGQFPQAPDGQPLLIDPTAEDPEEHLLLVPSTGRFEPRWERASQAESAKGRASIDTFALNRALLEKGRHDAWLVIQALIVRYDAHVSAGNEELAEKERQVVCRYPFSSVLVHLLRLAAKGVPGGDAKTIQPECLAVLARRREIVTWSDG